MRKHLNIIATAKAHPDWRQAQIAAHCGSTPGSVKVILHTARRDGRIKKREVDLALCRRTSLNWLPDRLRRDYIRLRSKAGATEARKVILAELAREAQAAVPRMASEHVTAI
jgi:hypothetical protein